MDAPNLQTSHHDPLTLREITDVLTRAKWLVIAFVALSVAATAIAAWLIPSTYEATILLSAVSDNSASTGLGGLTSIMSRFDGLASLAGMSLNNDNKKAASVAVLQSEALTTRYIQGNELLPILYPRKWNSKTHHWRVIGVHRIPTLWQANLYFKKHIRTVTTDAKTGLVTLTIKWTDPVLAARWANGLVKMTNDYLRENAIAESERNIAYLKAQAAVTDVVGVKQAIYTILENQINEEMLARGSKEYAFKVLDPAVAPQAPSSPRPVLWIAMALFGSLIASSFAAFAYAAWDRD